MGQPNLDQIQFRVGDDDGSESAHGWLGTLGQDLNAGPSQTIQDGDYLFLRFTIKNTGSKVSSGLVPAVEISYNGGSYANVGATGAFHYATHPTYLTDGENTTDRLGGTGTFDTSNQGVIEGTYLGASNELTDGYYEEVLIVLQFDQSQAVSNGDYYDIRVAGMDNWTDIPRFTITNLPTATINQTGYRFTSQDGTLASPTWQAAANTNVTMQRGKTVQLWVEIEEASGVSLTDGYELTWQKNGAGGYTTLQGYPWLNGVGSVPTLFGCESDYYTDGDSITSNPINQSAKTFTNGHGVESTSEADVESNTVALNNQCTVLCFTIRIPSLYGTTSAHHNEKNDYFDFQVRRDDGTALDTTLTARYVLGDGNGHIGGCPAETQGKLGPWKDSNGNLYYVTERSEVDNHICMMKSTDDGVNWAFTDSDTGLTDLESVDAIQVGDTIHIFFDPGGSIEYIPYYTSDHATTPDTFGTSSTPVASKTENDQGCAVGYRSGTADFVVFYRNGTTSEEIYYIIGTPGSWGSPLQLDSTNVNHIGVHVVKGADSDWLHIFYTTEETVPNTIRHRSMNPSTDALTASEVVYSDAYDGGSGWQWAMTSAIAWMSGSNDKVGIVIYDDSDNYPYFVAITDDGSPGTPVQIDNVTLMNDPTWMTSRSPVGKLFVDSNGVLYFIMADASTQDLWIYTSDDDGATWSDQTTPEELIDGLTAEMIIGQALTLSGTETLAYIYADRYGGFNDWVYFDTYALASGYSLPLDAGSYSITGQATGLAAARKLSLNAGSYSITGQITGLAAARKLSLDAGSYTITGHDVTLTYTGSYKLFPDTGSYSITGYAVTLKVNRILDLDSGSYTITGQAVIFKISRQISFGAGSYSITGYAVTFKVNRKLAPDAGSYAITGNAVTFAYSRALSLEAGSYTITGHDVVLLYSGGGYNISLDPGSYTITGHDVTFSAKRKLSLDAGNYTIMGYAVSLAANHVLALDAGNYTITGNAISLSAGRVLNLESGSYALTGLAAALVVGYSLAAGIGSYSLTGYSIELDYSGSILEVYTAGVYSNILPSLSLSSNISPAQNVYSNPSPGKEVESG